MSQAWVTGLGEGMEGALTREMIIPPHLKVSGRPFALGVRRTFLVRVSRAGCVLKSKPGAWAGRAGTRRAACTSLGSLPP